MRGKDFKSTVDLFYCRITPAYAGKSVKLLAPWSGFQDHPRLCGEKKQKSVSSLTVPGSPPPMRGKVFFFDPEHLRIGITPAYAGKSDVAQSVAQQTKDHPRLCGEKIRPTGFKLMIKGSPPPMRGKEQKGVFRMKRAGITPAYAGKSYDSIRKGFFQKDHPRLCGEKRAVYSPSSNGVGSPPPMRGKVRGKGPVCHRTQDHPRLCGEKRFAPASSSLVMGSPPPMRGKAFPVHGARAVLRITPAYAGKSSELQPCYDRL